MFIDGRRLLLVEIFILTRIKKSHFLHQVVTVINIEFM